jgi:4-amino-4-deoxy-L-arabinose transferase-like glycosyltransferase
VLLIAAQLPPPAAWAERLARLKLWAAAHRWELLALAGWLVLAGVLRIWHLAQIPYPFSGDEAAMGLEARAMLRGELRNPFATGWLSHPTLWFYCMSRFMTVFGSGIVGVRIMSALLGATTILTIYPLAREMCGVSVAQIAVALLAAYPLHIHFSRQGLSASADIWFTPLVLYFFDRGLRRNSYLCMAVSGVALGLMQYGYMTARIVPVIIIAYALYFLLTERGFLHKHGRGLLLFALCALIVWMPMGTWYLRHRSEFTARLGFSSILQPGWLQNEQLRTSRTALQILWDQTQRSFLALNYYQDTSPFYHAPAPLMSFLPSIFFIFGVAYALVHWRRRYFTLLLLWLGLVLFFGGVLTHSPPYVARLIAMIPAVCVLAALGLWKVVHFFGSLARYPKVRTGAIAAVMVGVMMLADVNWYFREYIPKPYFLDLNTEIGNILGHYLADVSPDYQVFFFGAPRMYISYSGIEFLAGRRVGADVVQPLPPGQRPAMVRGERRLIFIFLPERLGEMQAVRQFFPNGQELHFDGRFGKDIVIIYRVD